MTGQSAKMGEDISQGVRLAVDEWNARGGLLGRKIELMVEDDRADPKDAVSVANKVTAQGAIGVIGHYNSSCTIPASNIYHENNIVMITPSSTNPMVTDRGYPNVFRTCGRDDQQGKVEADFAAKNLKAKRVAIIHDKTTYGQGLADEFKKNLPSSAEIILYEGITLGDKDFSAVLTKAKSLAPDLLMFGGLYAEGGLLSKQMRDLNLNCIFLSGDGVYDPEFIRIAGPAAENAYISYAPSAEKIPTAQHFLQAYKARWPEIGPYSLFAYDAANVILTAIERAGTTSGLKVAEIIHRDRFSGAIGEIQFDAKGDPVASPYVMWVVKNGQLVQLEDEPVKVTE
jgi:branched-chain amino acid transport system substrate-binding protein